MSVSVMRNAGLLVLWTITWGPACARAAQTRGDGAQRDYLIETWETEQGLPENSATSMVQTGDGYLWFGTFNGLVRFDGVRFEILDRSTMPILPGPGVVNLDFSLTKTATVSEDVKMQFRAEFFNFLNRANLGIPSGTAFQGSTGRIDTTATTNRQIQFGLRFEF